MSNQEKNGTIDYSKFFQKKEKETTPLAKIGESGKQKKFSLGLGALKDFLAESDKKIRIEIAVFAGTLLAVILVLIYYFTIFS